MAQIVEQAALSPADLLTPRARPTAPPPAVAKVGDKLATQAGEKKRTVLTDGTVLYMDQNTSVELASERVLKVTAGQVYVEAAPANATNERESFAVETAQHKLSAKDTKFAVEVREQELSLLVTKGEVRFDDTSVVAGQTVKAHLEKLDEPAPAKRASHELGWTRDLMIAADTPLVPAGKHDGGALVAVDPYGQEAKVSLVKYHIDVHIEDGFARTTVDQTYFNHENFQMEGTFYFPLPPDASLSRLAMYVANGEMCSLMEGGMAERDFARQTYESIRYARRDPALLEWVDGSLFKMRVFPLEARQEKRLVLSYAQRLPVDYGKTTYRFPAGHSLNGVKQWSFEALVKGGAGMTATSPSHPAMKAERRGNDLVLRDKAEQSKIVRDVVLEFIEPGELARPTLLVRGGEDKKNTDLALKDAPSNEPIATDPSGPSPLLRSGGEGENARWSSAEHEGSRYLMLRYRPELRGSPKRERRDWVFLFEASGARDPLVARTQVEVVRALLSNAEHDDTFALLTVGTRVHKFNEHALRVTPENVANALEFLDKAHLIGALNLEQGLLESSPYLAAGANPHLVHLGGGIATLGAQTADKLIPRIPQGTRYVGVAVGRRFSPAFMKTAAEKTGGFFTQINPDEPIAWRGFELASALNTPRLLNISVAGVAKPQAAKFLTFVNALSQGEELAAVARIDGEAPESITLRGTLDGAPFERQIPVRDVAPNAGYLPRTWAKLEIDRLLAEDAGKHRQTITDLSKAMYVMTPFTSLLVLENEAMYQEFKVDRGRKDHWAMYPCPEKIPTVYIPDPNQPALGISTITYSLQKPHENVVKQTIVTGMSPQYFNAPGEMSIHKPLPTGGTSGITFETNYSILSPGIGGSANWNGTIGAGTLALSGTSIYAGDTTLNFGSFMVGSGVTSEAGLTIGGTLTLGAGTGSLTTTAATASTSFPTSTSSPLFPTSEEMSPVGQISIRDAFERVGVIRRQVPLHPGARLSQTDLIEAEKSLKRLGLDDSTRDLEVLDEKRVERPKSELLTRTPLLLGLNVQPDATIPAELSKFAGTYDRRNGTKENLYYLAIGQLLLGVDGDAQASNPDGNHLPARIVNPGFDANEIAEFGIEFESLAGRSGARRKTRRSFNWPLVTGGQFTNLGAVDQHELSISERNLARVAELIDASADRGKSERNLARLQDLESRLGDARRRLIDAGVPLDGGSQAPQYYSRPSFSGQDRVFTDLVSYAPGTSSSLADIRAVMEAEAAPRSGLQRGAIDPAARQRIESARQTGWRSIVFKDVTGADRLFHHDGQGRYAYEQRVGLGLIERVVCDGSTILHSYPELGIGARRNVSRFHRAELSALVPDVLPPADDFNHGFEVKSLDADTVALVPLRREAKPHAAWLETRLVFEGNRFAQRRWVLMPANKELGREVYANDGPILLVDASGNEAGKDRRETKLAAEPDLRPDVSSLVILPLPLRSRDIVFRKYDLDPTLGLFDGPNACFEYLAPDAALELLACEFAANNGNQVADIWHHCFGKQGDRRIGFFTLMASSGVSLTLGHQEDVFREIRERMVRDNSVTPLLRHLSLAYDKNASYLQTQLGLYPGPAPAYDFLSQLLEFRAIALRWQGNAVYHPILGQRAAERERALAFVRRHANNVWGWCALGMIADRATGAEFHQQIATAWGLLAQTTGLSYYARYEQAVSLMRAEQRAEARHLFRTLFEESFTRGVLPPVDSRFRDGFVEGTDGNEWRSLMRWAADVCLVTRRRPVIVRLAWQCRQLGDQALADELLTEAFLDKVDAHRILTEIGERDLERKMGDLKKVREQLTRAEKEFDKKESPDGAETQLTLNKLDSVSKDLEADKGKLADLKARQGASRGRIGGIDSGRARGHHTRHGGIPLCRRGLRAG